MGAAEQEVCRDNGRSRSVTCRRPRCHRHSGRAWSNSSRLTLGLKRGSGTPKGELLEQKPDMLMPRSSTGRKVKHRADEVSQPKIHPFCYGLTIVRRRDGTEFEAVINLGFLEVGGDTLISSAIQEVQRERRDLQPLAHIRQT